ncbi:hypothetical protein [Solidesulfovibrio magneticus]|nr:hypothetical protein [Solidesulfovibrio magneticus]
MTDASGNALTLLHFPCLTPAVSSDGVPGVRFLDPGLGEPGDPELLRPADLPLSQEELAGFLREFERLRRETKNPKDLALLAGAGGGHFFSETSFAVREALEDQLNPGRVALRRAKQAQLALCLAAMIEHSVLELAEAGSLDEDFRKDLAESLGIEDGDDDDDTAMVLAAAFSSDGGLPTPATLADEFRPPWRQLLSPFWAIAPVETGLFIDDPEIAATLQDADLGFDDVAPEAFPALFPGGSPDAPLIAARPSGYRLAGRTRPDPEAPWLDMTRLVVAVKP